MKETQFGLLFRHWFMANPMRGTFELKQTATDSWPFSALEQHQNDFSVAIRHSKKGVLIRNESGTVGAPDYSGHYQDPAYIVIKYPLGFVLVDIDTLNLEHGRSKRKSLTWNRAKEIAWKVV